MSELAVTRIGLGAWAIGGGDWILGWGPQKDADSLATIRRAIDLGINWIDTAAVYGLGHSEDDRRSSPARHPPRHRPYVLTACGLVWDELGNVSHSLDPDSIRREAEASLRRLDVDCIDLYQIGWPVGPDSPPGMIRVRSKQPGTRWRRFSAKARPGSSASPTVYGRPAGPAT